MISIQQFNAQIKNKSLNDRYDPYSNWEVSNSN